MQERVPVDSGVDMDDNDIFHSLSSNAHEVRQLSRNDVDINLEHLGISNKPDAPVPFSKRTRVSPPLLATHNLRRSLEKVRQPPGFSVVSAVVSYADDACPLKISYSLRLWPDLDAIPWPCL